MNSWGNRGPTRGTGSRYPEVHKRYGKQSLRHAQPQCEGRDFQDGELAWGERYYNQSLLPCHLTRLAPQVGQDWEGKRDLPFV